MTKLIDFNDLARGTVVDSEFSADGVTISAIGGSNQAMIFDTANPTGGDNDLATSNLGNVLIISEDGDSNDPDDEANGGILRFEFDTASTVNSLTFLDIEESAWVTFYDTDGNLIKTVDVHGVGNNGQRNVDFDVDNVGSFEVLLGGSGAIDNLSFTPAVELDGVVEGDNSDDVIDAGFVDDPDGDRIDANDQILPGEGVNDDIVDALGGDDTILSGAGNDEVFAGTGDDSVEGGAGDDVIFGDSNYAGPNAGTTTRESFEWDQAGVNNAGTLGGFTQDTGNVNVTFSIDQQSGASTTRFSTDNQNVQNIDADGNPVDDNSSLDNILNGYGNSADYNLDFSAPVEDVSFRINDIDGDGVVRVQAFDADGNQIVVNLDGGSRLTLLDTDGVAGNDTADSNEGYLPDTSPEYSLLVSIPGPVSRIEIEHDQDGSDNSGINITDVYFDATVVDDGTEGGDDILEGGAGNDTIFGEDGNDTLLGDDGNDSLEGGDGDDRIFGGAGNDTQIGGDGNDTLGGAVFGDDLFIGGAGDDLVEASFGNDTIYGGTGNDDLWASSDDDLVSGGEGNDSINGGHGRDTLFGDEGNDTIAGGSDKDTIEGGDGDDLIQGDGNFRDDTGADGSDLIDAGAGNDTVLGEGGDDTISGGDGDDLLQGGEGRDSIDGDGGNDTIFGGNNAGVERLNGGDGDDSIFGEGGVDVIRGGDGNDFLDSGDAHDELFGDAGNDTLLGGDSYDWIHGGTGDDQLFGEDGNDMLNGNEGNDLLVGGEGVDTIDGGADADTIVGGAGDVVDGGSGGFNTNPALNTDNDTLDLTGQGSFFLDNVTEDSNGNGTNGTVVFVDGAGNPTGETIVFTEIENIIGDEINRGPDATNNVYNVSEDEAFGDVDGNAITEDTGAGVDSDPDGDDLTVVAVGGTAAGVGGQVAGDNGGLFTVNADGTVDFSANDDFDFLAPGESTLTSVQYTVDDGNGGQDTALVRFYVTGTNDGPVAVDDALVVSQNDVDTDLRDLSALANDSDVDGDTIRIVEVTNGADTETLNNPFGPAGEVVSLEGSNGGTITVANDGATFFDANGDFDELAEGETVNTTVTYTVEDENGAQDTATITFTVTGTNDGPVAVNDAFAASADEVTLIRGEGILENDSDIDGDTLRVTEVTNGTDTEVIANPFGATGQPVTVEGTNGGLITIYNGGGADFDPNGEFDGLAEGETVQSSVTYTVSDGNGGTDTATVTFTVTGTNDGPVAVNDSDVTDEDTSITVDLLANDTDVDGDELTVTSATVPAEQGTLVDNGDGTVTFTPAENFNGEATISYEISDSNGGTDTAIHTIDVGAVNDGPDAVNDSDVTDEDTPITVDLLANDTDLDGDTLTVTGATVPENQGTLVDNGDGTVTFNPAENFNGEVTISYAITDGNGGTDTAIHTITVTPVNDAPVAVDDIAETFEDEPVVIDLIGNDTDVDGDPLNIGTVSVPAEQGTVVDNGDGTVTFTPAPNYTGPAEITYTVQDGQGGEDSGEAVVNVEVIGVNDGPQAVDDAVTTDEDTPITIDVLDNDFDIEGDELSITVASVPAEQGTVEVVDGELLFTPAENFNGEATITYGIEDTEGGADIGEVIVTVTPVNDDPVAVDDLDTTDEDEPVVVDLIGNDTDVDGDPLTLAAVSVDPSEGTVVDNGDGTVTFTPAPNFNGPATITYTVEDGQGGSDEGQAVVSVGAVNDGPVAEDDSDVTDEDTSVTVDLLANDTDADGDDLTVINAVVDPSEGTLVDNGDGTVTFTPAENFNGEATISYEISDSNGGTDTAIHTIDVTPVNDEPVANDDVSTTPFNEAVTFDVVANDTDVDGDDLTITNASSPDGTVEINGDELTFTPTPGFEGDAEVTYTISDGNGGEDTAVWTITVEEQPLDGIVEGTDGDDLIDDSFADDPEGDMVDNNDEILPGEGPNDDIIEAGGGNDTVIAGEGDDDVFGGTGDDQIHGGTGDDILRGEDGEDTINGGAGDDTVDGGSSDDVINTGDGSDEVIGGDGNDVIDTGNDDLAPDLGFPNDDGTPVPGFPFGFAADENPDNDLDFVDGGSGDDTISTGDDADTIIGGDGNDVIDGGIDDDSITGDDGSDRIVGGEGNDSIDAGLGNDTIFAGNDPDLGLDQLNIEDDGSNPLFPGDPRPDNGRDTVDGGEGDDLIFGADDDDVLLGGAGQDTIDGEIDNDFIDGGIGDDSLLGGQGNDTIEGGDGQDFIDGGRNADVLSGGAGDDTILGDNGADVINGGEGNDFIDGGTGDDTLNGDAGDDSILGATGDDVIDGGDGNDTIDGGNGGNDDLSGGDDRGTFINVNAGEVVDGNEGGDDFDTLDLTGSAPGGGSLNIVFDPTNPENGVVNYFDTNGDAAGSLTFSNIENVIPCFTPGTMVATPQGERRVEDLNVGDRVITRDNGIQEIRWIGKRKMSGQELAAAEHLRPVLIRQGALGKGLPERDMLVSPQHRVLMASDKTALYFDEAEVLVAAKHLTDMEGIDVVEVSGTTYIHVMFDQHEVILSDGAWTESFQPGDQTLASMGDAQRAEIMELFPELETETGVEAYTAARRSLKKHEAKLLTQ
ncbi:MAG: tandem-95 repeat protein [Tateyamaria sp.]|uniref:cadherin-like domain-containing protein n=1 Tax=Tateyamaria sp. TaxID=1929288 RepID=UPI00329C006D